MREDNPRLRRFAKAMRQEPTPAEAAVWQLIRNRRLAGFKFRRQHPFGPFILDCYCPAAEVVVELDGDTHTTPEEQSRDAERTRYLVEQGVLVLRYWNTEVAAEPDLIAEQIAGICAERVTQRRKPR